MRSEPLEEELMCPLCVATSTIALVGAGSAGGLGAITAKILRVMRKRGAQNEPNVAHPAPPKTSERHSVQVAYLGGDPFNASSGGL
jgi:hypothetical protein